MADRAATRLAVDLGVCRPRWSHARSPSTRSRARPMFRPACARASDGRRATTRCSPTAAHDRGGVRRARGRADRSQRVELSRVAEALRERGFAEDRARPLHDSATSRSISHSCPTIRRRPAALAGALASHDVVYYNGHSHDGDIEISPPRDYRLIVLDSCWSTQHFAERLISPDATCSRTATAASPAASSRSSRSSMRCARTSAGRSTK